MLIARPTRQGKRGIQVIERRYALTKYRTQLEGARNGKRLWGWVDEKSGI